jgi:APA family basic amino acid/polyamine antiporter
VLISFEPFQSKINILKSFHLEMETSPLKKPSLLGFFDLSMIVVSLVIGMGIFRTPVNVAQGAISPSIFFLAWSVGGLMAICGGLTFAEIGSRLPVSGGYFRIFAKCYHPSFAFMLNGTILVSNAASVAGVALIGAEYSSHFIFPASLSPTGSWSQDQQETQRIAIALVEILLFLGLNLLGLKTSAITQSILTVFKLLVVLLLICAIFVPADTTTIANKVLPVLPQKQYQFLDYIKSLGLCLIPISFTYGGYQQTINFGGEIQNAKRIMPKSIITGMLIVVFLYIAINFAYFRVIGFDNLKSAENIASLMANRILGEKGGIVLSLMLIFSVLAYVNVGLMSNPRVICAMSEDGTLPKFFSFHSKRFNVPVISLITFSLATIIILCFAKNFNKLVDYVIFLDSIGFIAAAATIFILRSQQGSREGEIYKVKPSILVPAFFILTYSFITWSVIYNNPISAMYGIVLSLLFLLLYFLYKRIWMWAGIMLTCALAFIAFYIFDLPFQNWLLNLLQEHK